MFLKTLSSFGIPEDAWAVIAPESEKEQREEHHEGCYCRVNTSKIGAGIFKII